MAHSDAPIVCHKTARPGGLWSGALQCAGAASYRANVCKQPRDERVACDPRSEAIFQRPQEFLDHHNKHENGEAA